jgi:hypothetical protein
VVVSYGNDHPGPTAAAAGGPCGGLPPCVVKVCAAPLRCQSVAGTCTCIPIP